MASGVVAVESQPQLCEQVIQLICIAGCKLLVCPDWLVQQVLQQSNLTFLNAPCLTDFDALLLSKEQSGLFVALRFEAGVVFPQLIGRPSYHFQNSGSVSEYLIGQQFGYLVDGQFVRMAEEPAPAFHWSCIVKCRSGDVKMLQLQEMNLQVVCQGERE